MNSATRVLQPAVYHRSTDWSSSREILLILCLGVLVLLSAISVVYVKDLNRRLFITKQTLQHQHEQYLTDWSQLLLEQSAWSNQARIQQVAQQKLNMRLP